MPSYDSSPSGCCRDEVPIVSEVRAELEYFLLPSHEDGDDDAEVSDDGEENDGRQEGQLLVVGLIESRILFRRLVTN